MGPCMCGDPYCGSCGSAQGYYKCEHKAIQGECANMDCPNGPDDHYINCAYCNKLHFPSLECKERIAHFNKLYMEEAEAEYQFYQEMKAEK